MSSSSTHHRNRLIYLTGFMASGKSTIGPILANTLGYNAIDLDRAIEAKAGKTIAQMFHDDGEASFRSVERETLTELSTLQDYVVSLGGGTILQEENLRILTTTGIVVYLKVDVEQLFKRLRHKTDRPVLHDDA